MQEKIYDALRRGAHDEALALARETVATDPDNAQSHRYLAMALNAGGDRDAALLSIDRAIALAPDDADLHFHRAGYLLGGYDIEAAQTALTHTLQLDPNQYGAYIMQAQLALGREDLDEAERNAKLAARIAPEHPWTQTLQGTLALQRGEDDRALALLTDASRRLPDDDQVRYSLGFAYLRKGHLAFAEHAFRHILDRNANAGHLRGLIADLQLRQGRPDDAADTLAPLLDAADATPAQRRLGGELQLAAGRLDAALALLRSALAAQPGDPRTLAAIFEVWRRKNDPDDARRTLDAALATSPQVAPLWRARMAVEPVGSDEALAVIERWRAIADDPVPADEARMDQHGARGEAEQAERIAQRIVDAQPDHMPARARIVDGLLRRDPVAAAGDDPDLGRLRGAWLGIAQDRAGRYADAADTWRALHAEAAEFGIPLPDASAPRQTWPDRAPTAPDATPVAFLAGMPGSGVERLAALLAGCMPGFRDDRFGPRPPADALQNVFTIGKLGRGELEPAEIAAGWQAQLPARGIANGQVIDWLLWWDNALLDVLRPHLPHARVLIALRDPRDMLLDWLAFGAPVRFRVPSANAAAGWLAIHLNQLATLDEGDLFPRALIRMDALVDDEAAAARALGDALGATLPVPPAGMFGAPRFAAGHWRRYAEPLAEPFALLTPVARRLGYPDL